MKRPLLLIIVVLMLGVLGGIAVQRYWLGMQDMDMRAAPAGPHKEILYYRNPMTPTITSDKPKKDSMGMDYIPVYADGAGNKTGGNAADDATVAISPAVVNTMGVRTAPVERGPLARRIDTVAYVGYDEDKLHHVHIRTEGWVENLLVKFVGARVKKGDLLFELYAPKLVNAQEEYVQALNTGNKFLLPASRARLRALGVPDDLIDRLTQTRKVEQRVKTFADQDGVVQNLNIREGMFIEPATEAMSLVDLSSVWVMADIFEQQLAWVEPGQQAEMRLAAMPDKIWKGQVDYIYPSLDPATRTLKARLRFANPDELLKPNMFADVAIFAAAKENTLSIPREALIRTGAGQRVIMALGAGKFAPREVKAGIESGERIEIREGLTEGEKVVVSGQFLIDSESSIKTSLTRMTPVPTAAGDAPATIEKIAQGTGMVKAVDASKVNISHGPIEALRWPPMTMDFRWADPAQASGIKPGDTVQFEFREGEEGQYIITRITPKAVP